MSLKREPIICLNSYVYVHFNAQIFRIFQSLTETVKVRTATLIYLTWLCHMSNTDSISVSTFPAKDLTATLYLQLIPFTLF